MYVPGIFCYLAQAFDCVNHELLLFQLHYFGVQGEILDWFKLYLYNKKQWVELKSSKKLNFCSIWEMVKHRVPHGSFLDPLLFDIYINNFPL